MDNIATANEKREGCDGNYADINDMNQLQPTCNKSGDWNQGLLETSGKHFGKVKNSTLFQHPPCTCKHSTQQRQGSAKSQIRNKWLLRLTLTMSAGMFFPKNSTGISSERRFLNQECRSAVLKHFTSDL